MIALRLGWRMLRRDLAAGEVRVLLAALVLAVCAVSSVGFVTDRAARALALESNRLLGGDAVLRGDAPLPDAAREDARTRGLQIAETQGFPSMLRAGDQLKLSELRALGPGFPLRGTFRIQQQPDGPVVDATGVPAPGTLWLSRAGAETLGAALGDTIQVGDIGLKLVALVVQEPDSALDYFNVAPRAFFSLDDLPKTGLVQFGSRISYRLVVAGDAGEVEAWVAARRAARERGQRLETAADARPEIRRALERADQFLGLSALVAVVLAGIAVAMAARRHAAHHLDGCAVMRCLGAQQRTVLSIHAGELAWLGIAGSAGGVVLGWLIQVALGSVLARVLGVGVPAAGWLPAAQGFAVGACVLLAFGLPPILALRRVPAMRVLRRDLGGLEPSALLSMAAGLAGLGALLWWKAGSATIGTVMLAGIVATLAVLALLAWAMVLLVRALRGRLRGPWRYGLANVARRARASVIQVSALGLGLMVILLLTLVRTDLIGRWQRTLAADAPNRFIINVQPDQRDAVLQRLVDGGVDDAQLYPMVRGRLVEVNGAAVSGDKYEDRQDEGRARRLAEREFNLSSAATLREDNDVVAGAIWPADYAGEPQLSVESGLAATLGWKLGDRVAFDLAGTRLAGTITSLREVDWESFKPNFFVLVSPGALDAHPSSHITAVHLPADNPRLTDDLVREFPNLTVIDVDAVLAQVRATADQVATAVEYVFYFTVLAGLLVLLAAVTATQDERLLEGGVMRVFGASSRQLRLAQLSEFAAIGLLAGTVAAIAAGTISGLIATRVFDLPWAPDWRLAAYGGLAGMLAVSITGLVATRGVASAPPTVTLRALQGN